MGGRDLRHDPQDDQADHRGHDTAKAAVEKVSRVRNCDEVADRVAKRVKDISGRISAKRLLPAARAAGYEGSARNFRRLVVDTKRAWRRGHPGGRPGVGRPGGR